MGGKPEKGEVFRQQLVGWASAGAEALANRGQGLSLASAGRKQASATPLLAKILMQSKSLHQQMPPVACSTQCTAHDPGRHLAGRAGWVRSGARSKAAVDGTQRKGKAISRKDKTIH